ncbi:MAG TPA: helix-turn-helix domain-containing GNAT family N-acetyltransferase [Actinomycetota bacterium]|jgi:DNA-binding MarR family transcriptional regulator/GNAT superfamily N-acetyltransferase|nr:helix-turn-helix domain-containing GNAT family N-acetyltransferase [Actinomycetota bacterium]
MNSTIDQRIGSVRAFNRFYTNVIGALRGGLLDTPYSLTEARVLFELGHADATEVAELRRALDIDRGHLSRMLSRFDGDGLVVRERSTEDGRRQVIRLSDAGRATMAMLGTRADDEVRNLLAPLSDRDQGTLIGAMGTIRSILERTRSEPSYVIRPLGPGDLGWVVHRHGVLYATEYGWDETFEGLVAQIVADYARDRDERRESAWIAEVHGEPAGCVFCTKREEHVAQLRLLLVEPETRGMGLGARLVDECIRFARRAGYRQIMLWTNDVLTAARRIYEKAGFQLVEEGPHKSFGKDLVEQTWALTL